MRSEFTVSDRRRSDRSTAARWILSHCIQHRLILTWAMLGLLILAVLNSSIYAFVGRAFDAVREDPPDRSALATIALIMLAIVVLRGIADLTASLAAETLAKRLERDSRDELYISLLGKSQTFHNRQRVGDLMARAANDVRSLNDMLNPGVALIYESIIAVAIPMIFIAFTDVRLLLVPFCFIAAFILSLRLYVRRLTPVSSDMRRRFGMMNAGLNETVSGIDVVKSTAQEEQELGKFNRAARGYRDAAVAQGKVQARYLPTLLLSVTIALSVLHGLWLLDRGDITFGELVSFIGFVQLLRFPTFISIFTFSLVGLGLSSAERILQLLREETELDQNPAGHQGRITGEIVFEHVSFAYDGEGGLRDISFRAEPGQTVAIVGETGSGKSTLTKLVNRIYDVDSGRILIDGVDVREWNLTALRSQISTIEQDIVLFSRPVAENIAFSLGQQADMSAIEQAARDAQADEFIRALPEGYETVIGERGVTLSGGQRQRIAIARALLTDPRILMLDDSTSAIDSATEDQIQRAIRRVLEGRTTLLITHRLSQIRWADKIIVLRRGEIVDQGTHEELLARCDLYRRIFARYESTPAARNRPRPTPAAATPS